MWILATIAVGLLGQTAQAQIANPGPIQGATHGAGFRSISDRSPNDRAARQRLIRSIVCSRDYQIHLNRLQALVDGPSANAPSCQWNARSGELVAQYSIDHVNDVSSELTIECIDPSGHRAAVRGILGVQINMRQLQPRPQIVDSIQNPLLDAQGRPIPLNCQQGPVFRTDFRFSNLTPAEEDPTAPREGGVALTHIGFARDYRNAPAPWIAVAQQASDEAWTGAIASSTLSGADRPVPSLETPLDVADFTAIERAANEAVRASQNGESGNGASPPAPSAVANAAATATPPAALQPSGSGRVAVVEVPAIIGDAPSTPGVGAPVVAEDATAASPRPVQTLQELYAELLRARSLDADAARLAAYNAAILAQGNTE